MATTVMIHAGNDNDDVVGGREGNTTETAKRQKHSQSPIPSTFQQNAVPNPADISIRWTAAKATDSTATKKKTNTKIRYY